LKTDRRRERERLKMVSTVKHCHCSSTFGNRKIVTNTIRCHFHLIETRNSSKNRSAKTRLRRLLVIVWYVTSWEIFKGMADQESVGNKVREKRESGNQRMAKQRGVANRNKTYSEIETKHK
jgi:hypothetical protein